MLFVTHNMREAVRLADRVILMAAGRIVHEQVVDLPRPRHMDSAEVATRAGDLTARLRAAGQGGRRMSATVLTPVVGSARGHRDPATRPARRVWAWSWPKLLAIGLVLGVWQVVVWSGWRPEYVLPGPATVLGTALGHGGHGAVLVRPMQRP